jgi:hypothetical protein
VVLPADVAQDKANLLAMLHFDHARFVPHLTHRDFDHARRFRWIAGFSGRVRLVMVMMVEIVAPRRPPRSNQNSRHSGFRKFVHPGAFLSRF